MNFMMNFDVWKLVLIVFMIVNCSFGKPYNTNIKKDSNITKRVEIIGDKNNLKNQASVRRQNVIHAGDEYETEAKGGSQPQPDDLEDLGKIVDYNGKIIDSGKSVGAKTKDTPGINKDVIARIKEIQDTLIKRTGTKDLVQKLKLMQPEKNITISSSSAVPLNSRKVIPEDVVNKILDKFQELRSQAKTLATLDEKGKVEEKESDKKPIVDEETLAKEKDSKETSSKETESKEAVKEDKKQEKNTDAHEKQKSSSTSPYESIGPPKDNEELRNITASVSHEGPNGEQSNQEIVKAPNLGPAIPLGGSAGEDNEPNRMNQQRQQAPEEMRGNQMRQNTPGNMMMMGGKVPMMFIKQGEMLVPVFGGQGGANQQFQRSVPLMAPTPQMMANARLIPQSSSIETGRSRSGPQTPLEIPSIPLSTIMSLMSAPNAISNLPASPMIPPQMNGGVYNVPQASSMPQAGFMPQYPPGVVNNQPNGETTGQAHQIMGEQNPSAGRDFTSELQGQTSPFEEQPVPFQGQGLPFQGPASPFPGAGSPQGQAMPLQGPPPNFQGLPPSFQGPPASFQGPPPSFQGQLSQFQSQFSPFQEQGSPFEEKPVQSTANFMGGFPGQSSAMGNPGRSMGYGMSMDQSGKLSVLNPSNSGFMPAQPMGPLSNNPFQDTHPEARNNLEIMNKEKQMLNPYMSNPVNDLSDPVPGAEQQEQAKMRNLNPDALLELAKSHKTDPDSTENIPSNPDSLLDNLKQGQLRRELTGPGDPERIGVNGAMNAQPANPFAGTSPESLLDMLSKRNSKQIWNKNTMDQERETQNRIMESLRNENQAFNRGGITQIGTNGMQGISSLPVLGGLDPSFADYTTNTIGNQAVDVSSKSSALDNPVESSFFRGMAGQGPRYRKQTNPNQLDVLSKDTLKYENSKHAIDSGEEDVNPANQADVYTRHRISNPDYTGSKRSMKTPSLHHDNIELRVNGKTLAERGSLRSKIVDGKVHKGQGKILTSKSPVKIELSHADDAKKTKIINIVTSGKYKVTDSKRDKVLKHDTFLKKFYRRT